MLQGKDFGQQSSANSAGHQDDVNHIVCVFTSVLIHAIHTLTVSILCISIQTYLWWFIHAKVCLWVVGGRRKERKE